VAGPVGHYFEDELILWSDFPKKSSRQDAMSLNFLNISAKEMFYAI
jgi:hypothetical protein